MKSNDPITKYVVLQKLALVQSILNDLAEQYDFHFALNHTLLDSSSKILINDVMLNKEVNLNILDKYIQQMSIFKFEQQTLINLIANGALMYVCTDASNKPAGIKDWLVEGRVYIGDHLHPDNETGECMIFLRDMDPSPCAGYSGKRFQQLFNKFSLN